MSGRKRHDGTHRRMIFPPLWHMRPAKRPAGQAPPCFYTSSVVLFRHEHATDRQVLPALPDDDARGSGRVRPLRTSVPHRPNRNDARPGPATPDAAVHSAAPPPARCARHLRSSPHAGGSPSDWPASALLCWPLSHFSPTSTCTPLLPRSPPPSGPGRGRSPALRRAGRRSRPSSKSMGEVRLDGTRAARRGLCRDGRRRDGVGTRRVCWP